MGQMIAEATEPTTADTHRTISARGAITGNTATTAHVAKAARSTPRGDDRAAIRPERRADTADSADRTAARTRLRVGENWYAPAVTKKSPAQNAPPLIEPRNVIPRTAPSGTGRVEAVGGITDGGSYQSAGASDWHLVVRSAQDLLNGPRRSGVLRLSSVLRASALPGRRVDLRS